VIGLVGLASWFGQTGPGKAISRTIEAVAPGPTGKVVTDAVDQAYRAGTSGKWVALVFGLLIGFLAAGVWSNNSSAQQAVDSEASALRSVDLLDRDFPAADQRRLDLLIRSYIEQVVTHEWPAMAHQNATLVTAPPQMALALQVALALPADNPGRVVAQREIVTSLEAALDARRQRIIISQSAVNSAKWAGVIALGILTLIAIACVHAANRRTAAIAMTLWASAVVVSLLMIGVQDRPFAGPYHVQPTPLVQVEPQIPS